MGDFNINYLKESERTNLSTVLNPYGLKVCNTFLPTRINENGSSIIDYIVTDTSFTDSFVCDKIVKSDHLAQLVISHCNIKPSKEAVRKVIFDKRYYSRKEFCNTLSQQNWVFLWTLADPEKQLEYFTNTFKRVLRLQAPKKAVIVRTAQKSHLKGWFNDECKHALQEKQDVFRTFSENQNETNRKHYREKQRNFRKVISSNEAKVNKDLLRQLSKDKDRWKFINEQRNSARPSVSTDSLRNSFGDVLTGPIQIAELLNYNFSKLGEYLGRSRSAPPNFRETEHDKILIVLAFARLLYAK